MVEALDAVLKVADDKLVAVVVMVGVVAEDVVVEAASVGRKRLRPRPSPKAETIAMMAPTAICLLY
jgi:hypothetical protein